jgi:O-antigen/teichoic acid export membrane protein
VKQLFITTLDYFFKDSFRRNSIFNVFATVLRDIVGFIFWIIVARFYNVKDVGFATALLASVNLIYIFARLGLDVGLVRFIHDERDKSLLVNTGLTVVGIASIVLSLVYINGLNVWSAVLQPITGQIPILALFVLLSVLFSLFWILNSTFLAFRKAHLLLFQAAVLSLRIIIVIPLVFLGVAGILSSYAIVLGAAVIIALIQLAHIETDYRPVPTIQKSVISRMFTFSAGNYVADAFRMLPGLVLPVLIVNMIGAESSAYFYIAWTVGTTLFGIASAVNTVFLAEMVADQEQVRNNIVKVAKLLALLIGPLVVLTLVYGKWLLWLFGAAYAGEGLMLLSMLALTAIPLTINEVFIALKKLEKNVMAIVLMRVFVAASVIVGGLLLSKSLGIGGIGVALLASQSVLAIIVFPQLIRTARGKLRQ